MRQKGRKSYVSKEAQLIGPGHAAEYNWNSLLLLYSGWANTAEPVCDHCRMAAINIVQSQPASPGLNSNTLHCSCVSKAVK